jgi:hypothetical protein
MPTIAVDLGNMAVGPLIAPASRLGRAVHSPPCSQHGQRCAARSSHLGRNAADCSSSSLLPPPLWWRPLALTAFLVSALASAASLAAEPPPTGIGAPPDSAPIVRSRSSDPTPGAASMPGAAIAAPQTTTPADPQPSSTALVFAGLGSAAGCDAQSMLPDPRLVRATDGACVAPALESDQAYLVATATPGTTMLRQGSALAITRLHPVFVRRLAGAIREARDAGLPSAGIFSAYRPPAFGVGRFSDKFNSLHSYGLAVDMLGIGGPGSSEAKVWHEIATRHGIVCPYGANNPREWNHCQPTGVKIILVGNPLRGTISPQGPIDLTTMFAVGAALVEQAAAPGVGQFRSMASRPPAVQARMHRAASNENALAKRIKEENARINRLLKGICRGC